MQLYEIFSIFFDLIGILLIFIVYNKILDTNKHDLILFAEEIKEQRESYQLLLYVRII